MPAAAVRSRLPRGLTSDADLPFERAVMACMKEPSVLVLSAGTNVVVSGTMQRWSLSMMWSRHLTQWKESGARLRTVKDPGRRGDLLRRRREALSAQVQCMTVQPDPLAQSLQGLPTGMPSEAGAVALWWWHQRAAGHSPESAWCLLGLILPPDSLRYYGIDCDGFVRSRAFEIVSPA